MEPLNVLQADIRACTKCQDAGYIPEARPLTTGDANARFMVIGQAPSRTAHVTHTFYRGPAGERLRSWFVEAGFTQEDFGTRVILPRSPNAFRDDCRGHRRIVCRRGRSRRSVVRGWTRNWSFLNRG